MMKQLLLHAMAMAFLSLVIQPTPTTFVNAKIPLIRLKQISEGFTAPVGLVDPKDGTTRLFVVERGGLIKVMSRDGTVTNATPFLDVSSFIKTCTTGYCETGLLGLAFHPDFSNNGYFYINHTDEDSSGVLYTIISRFTADASDPDIADPSSALEIMRFSQTYQNHNGGDLQFGPDGYLYIASGDGGGWGDPNDSAQQLNTMLGKILRIDVDSTSGSNNYTIPLDNPFVDDSSALDEIWAYGLRNPWKISFDMANGHLWIADVGQNQWEELNFQPKSSTGGENYGWRKMEGNHCYEPSTCDENDPDLTPPLLEYEHVDGACSITGGYMFRGKPQTLRGIYFYGDYCNGKIWGTRWEDGKRVVRMVKDSDLRISSFGQDVWGKVYVVAFTGEIYKITRCQNNKKFNLGKPWKTCEWIKMTEYRKNRHCAKAPVKNHCPWVCGTC